MQDRIWSASTPGGGRAQPDDSTALTRALGDLSIAPDRRAVSAGLDANNPGASSRSLPSGAILSSSMENVDPRHMVFSSLNQQQAMQQGMHHSPNGELDLAPSPVSLGPHPDPRHAFHASMRSPVSESRPLNALNLTHPVPHINMQHVRQRQRLPHGVQPHPFNHHAAIPYNDPLHLSPLHYSYAQQHSPVGHALIGGHGIPLSSSPGTDVHQGRKGRVAPRPIPRIKNELYKTEICRSYSQTGGFCKYGAKCQFAHGDRERRPVRRHPRYKTKLCRNYVTTGQCPYGSRCRFIHASDLRQEDDELSMGFGILSAPLDAMGPLSFVGPLSTATPQGKAGLELLSSDSQSTASPDRAQIPIMEGGDPRAGLVFGNGHFQQQLNNPGISVDSFMSMRQDLLPALSNGVSNAPHSAIPLDTVGASNLQGSPTKSFALAADADNGAEGSPSGEQPVSSPDSRTAAQMRSRLPVFQTMSETFTNGTN